jgi:hypothetical protein
MMVFKIIRYTDHWLGTKIYQPVLIWICQIFGISQYKLYRILWWTASSAVLYGAAPKDLVGYMFYGLQAVFVIGWAIAVVYLSDIPKKPDAPFRHVLLMAGVLGGLGALIRLFSIGDTRSIETFILLALSAEYALTITTIPPKPIRKNRRVMRSKLASVTG